MLKERSKQQKALELEKKKELERQRKLEQEKRNNIERIDRENRQQNLRVAVLASSIKEFEDLPKEIAELEKVLKEQEEWDGNFDKNKLPDFTIPANIRDFLYQWHCSLQEYWDQQYNWWLNCDDRCLLTQEQDPDIRRVAIKKLRDKTGKFYGKKIRELLKVHENLMLVLENKKIPQNIYEDLLTIRNDIRDKAIKFLDTLTFEVTRHIDREMESIHAMAAKYTFTSADFSKFVWSFKDVPLPPNYAKFNKIQMDPLQMNVTMSNRIDLSSKVVRGMWWKNDFFSDFCPCFEPPELICDDLRSSVQNEWKVRRAMTEKHLKSMIKAREVYEQELIEKQKEEEEKLKNAKKNKSLGKKNEKAKKGGKKPKRGVKFVAEPIPPTVDEATYVNVDAEYEKYESNLIDHEHENFSPESLNLSYSEVNLREYQILNGVFKIECFERPSQTQEINHQIFIRFVESPNTIKYHHFHHVYQPVSMQQVVQAKKSILQRSPSIKLAEDREKAFADLVKVEIKLNEKLYWWEAPTVCRWEPWEESSEFKKLDKEIRNLNLNYDEIVEKERKKLFSVPDPHRCKKEIQMNDFDLTSPPEEINRYALAKRLVSMMPEEFKFFFEQLKVFKIRQREWRNILIAKRELSQTENPEIDRILRNYFEKTWKSFQVENVTIEQFNKFMVAKLFEPQNLFPVEHRKMIEVLVDHETLNMIEEDRNEFRIRNFPMNDDADDAELRPLRNEPIAISELLEQIENVKKSLRPFMWNVELPKAPKIIEKEIITKKKRRTTTDSKTSFKSIESRKRRSAVSRSSMSSRQISSTKSTVSFIVEEFDEPEEVIEASKASLHLIPHAKGSWSIRDIYETKYDPKTQTVTFFTGSLGTFGLASRKYCNLPLKSWEISPNIENNEKIILMKISTPKIVLEIKMSELGFTFSINTKKGLLLMTPNPLTLKDLKNLMISMNLTIFPEPDADFYIQDNCEKHLPMEFHTYKSMAAFCLSHQYKSNDLNKFATLRIALFESEMIEKKEPVTLMVTPLKTASVIVSKKTDGELEYKIEPADQEFQPDLLSFLKTQVSYQQHQKNSENFKIIWLLQSLLFSVRPLSFS